MLPCNISKMFIVSKTRIQVEMERNRLTSFAVAKEDLNSETISKFCWSIGNEKCHCFHLIFYSLLNVYKHDFYTGHLNETSLSEVIWFSLGFHSWSFSHSTNFCYVTLSISLNYHRHTNNSQIRSDEIRLLSSKLKLPTTSIRFSILVIRH